MIHHFTHQAIDARWHAVYRMPGCGSLSSIGDALTKAGAQQIADRANREQRDFVPAGDPAERPLARGFYTDKDAA